MKRWITLGMVILLVLPCTQTSFASARKKKTVATETKKEPTKRQSKYDKLVKNKSCETARGEFVTLHKLDGKVYFEFPVKYLGREMLLASTISEASDNNLCAIGYKPKDPMHIKFTKTDSTIFMREVNVSATCNPQEGHMREVMARSFMDPIIGSYKIYCYTNDSSAFLLDMTSLFTGNSERLAPISSGGGMVEITAVFNSAGSILDGIKAFDDNVTVKSYLSYSVSAKMMGMFIVKKNEPLTVKATRTLLLLPEEKMHPRVSDTRIGVFVTNTKQHISTDEDRIQIYTLANRWRVEPKDVEAYKRGELVEPVKLLYKDEVRVVGEALGLPHNMVYRQPFPGPGLGVRCLGAITRDRLHALREADAILREEFDKNGLAGKVWQYFIAVPDFKSVGVRDGKRYEGWAAIIRAVNTTDAMSATIEEIPYSLIHHITDRITHEVEGINRVMVDVTPKPVGTIEFE